MEEKMNVETTEMLKSEVPTMDAEVSADSGKNGIIKIVGGSLAVLTALGFGLYKLNQKRKAKKKMHTVIRDLDDADDYEEDCFEDDIDDDPADVDEPEKESK